MGEYKTFKELKPGDKIYYWDKGKMHEQIVHVCEPRIKDESFTNYFGKRIKNEVEELYIEAGKNHRTKYTLRYSSYDTHTIFGRMHRFASIECANDWLKSKRSACERNINKLEKRLNSLKQAYKTYDISITQ